MEVQVAVKKAVRAGGGSPPHHATTKGKSAIAVVANYLKPSTGSCHHACKYGGVHTFQDNKDAPAPIKHKQPKAPRKQKPLAPPRADHQAKTRNATRPPLISRAPLVPRMRLFGRGGGVRVQEEAAAVVSNNEQQQHRKAAAAAADEESGVEWKDIVAYVDAAVMVPGPSEGSRPGDAKIQQKGSPDNKKPVVKPHVGPKPTTTTTSVKASGEPRHTDMNSKSGARPTSGGGRKKPAVSSRKKAIVVGDQAQLVGGGDASQDQYQPVSPSLLRERTNLLRELEEEMTTAAASEATPNATTTDVIADEFNKAATCYSALDRAECAAAAAAAEAGSSKRPVPAHRRVKSTSVVLSTAGSSRSVVRFPFTRQGSRNGSSFKLRSKSSRGLIALSPSQEETKPARTRSRRGSSMGGGDEVLGSTSTTGRGVQLRIRSLRRRGLGGGGGASTGGFVVPAVSLRHQKTLEKKRSQRLYNSVIEETASRLAQTRKSRVKALVGAFESVISRIAK